MHDENDITTGRSEGWKLQSEAWPTYDGNYEETCERSTSERTSQGGVLRSRVVGVMRDWGEVWMNGIHCSRLSLKGRPSVYLVTTDALRSLRLHPFLSCLEGLTNPSWPLGPNSFSCHCTLHKF